MLKYAAKRAAAGAVTLFALAAVTFFLMHVIPGSPFAGETSRLPAYAKEQLISEYGLDRPVGEQFAVYLKKAVTGNFGTSLNRKGKLVSEIITAGLPATASLGLAALCLSVGLGVIIGTASAFSRKKWVSSAAALLSTLGASVPGFLLGLLMIILFGVVLRWLPFIGLDNWQSYIMPATALSFAPVAMISRLVKNSLTEASLQDYMTLAKSTGASKIRLVTHHAMKNALIPVITYAGPLTATLLTGSFVVENLFSVPGIGAEFVMSVSNRDYTLIMALTLLYGSFVIVSNIIADLAAALIDPRIRLK